MDLEWVKRIKERSKRFGIPKTQRLLLIHNDNKFWQMPSSNTFSIKPIKELIEKYATGKIVDPFANSNKLATVTNDLDTQYDTDYHMDALDFLKIFDDNSVDVVLYDPPYSPRQVSECYKNLGQTVNRQHKLHIGLSRRSR